MRIGLFATCLGDTLFPEAVKSTAVLLARLGHEVVFPPGQTCCGQMHVNTGYQREPVPLVRNFAEQFGDASIDAVVMPSGSCAGSVRHQHEIVAERYGDAALRAGVATVKAKTYELSEFLVDVLDATDVGAYFPHRVTYHPTCHSLRMLRVGDKPLRLLRAVDSIDLVELPEADACCGFGGTFAVKNADTSTAMLQDKMANIATTDAAVCTMRRLVLSDAHRRRALPDQVRHPHPAPGADPLLHPHLAARPDGGRPMSSTFLGMPATPPRSPYGTGNLRGDRKFPQRRTTTWATNNCAATSARPPTPSAPNASTSPASCPTGRNCATRDRPSRPTP